LVTTAKPSSRDRLLDAAAKLFYRDGVHVGVHALCEAAGVSKRSMYQMFATKDELVAATLEYRGPWYQALFLSAEDDERTPRERILHVFHRIEELSGTETYRGCPFVSTALELKHFSHPANEVARRFKQELTDFFQRQAGLGGAHDAPTLAKQLTIIFDGASARGAMYGESLAGLCVTAASALLDAGGVS
jgi:AcrR family transcriptional regulator